MKNTDKIDSKEFQKVIDSRRAVRIFDNTLIPEHIVRKCLENGLLAPNSSNLQPWEIYWIRNSKKKAELVKVCHTEIAAKTASELIVVVGRPSASKTHSQEMVAMCQQTDDITITPELQTAFDYYSKVTPYLYGVGSLFGFIKRIVIFLIGLKKPVVREPVTKAELRTWAVRSSTLAAENIMLSFKAYGFDTCPLDGFDSKRVKKLLNLAKDAVVVLVIAAGKASPAGIFGPRFRFDSKRFIKEI